MYIRSPPPVRPRCVHAALQESGRFTDVIPEASMLKDIDLAG